MDSLSINGATVVGGREASYGGDYDDATYSKGKGKMAEPPVPTVGAVPESKRIFRAVNHLSENSGRPFFVPTRASDGGMLAALRKLDEQITKSGRTSILSKKVPTDWIGKEINPGELGLINHGGLPKLLLEPGRYPPFPLRWWWAREFCGTKGLSDTVIEFNGLLCVQVSQNQAAVISDPSNQVFVVQNGGFAAYSVDGSYRCLAVVDQVHLPTLVKDPTTKQTLGSMLEVSMSSALNGNKQSFVVAVFMSIPANNCAILQRGDDLELLPAGQFYITDPNVTVRGFYTCGECQYEMPTKDIFTRDQVPVSLTIYLKWQLLEPLKLATHGYSNPYEALRDKAQSILTQIMSHLEYGHMMKQRGISPNDTVDDGSEPQAAFLDALRTRAMDDLYLAAQEYGITLKDLAVIERTFKGEIANTMDRLTQRALQAQVEAANVDRENSNKVKTEEGALQVMRIKAQASNAKADADAYAVVAAAKAQAEALRIRAEAEAEATRLTAQAEADGVKTKAAADAAVVDPFAREMEARRIEISRVAAFGNKTVFMPTSDLASRAGDALAVGMAASMGRNASSS